MTNEEINIAIAEACGWRIDPSFEDGELMGWWRDKDDQEYWDTLPDFCNDLNACHEMEKVLGNLGKQVEYIQNLEKEAQIQEQADWWIIAHATASQRAEAFLRTIGKWKDSASK